MMMSVADRFIPHIEKVDIEYFALDEAARRAGYKSTSTLQAAARSGRLRTLMGAGKPPYLTSQPWLDDYLAGLRFNTQFRGKPRGTEDDEVME